jgi:hypothetical protein
LAAIMAAGCASITRAESLAPADAAAKEKGPRTLLDALLGNSGAPSEASGEDRIEPDRPHLPEASTTVGLGRTVIEGGYTFTSKGSEFVSHSAPELLVRTGAFAEWFELRIGQSLLDQRQTIDGIPTHASGAQDLYLGAKVAVTQQHGLLPQIAVIPQMTVPTGAAEVTARQVLPGVNVDMSWEIIKNFFGLELVIGNNRVQDELGGLRHELSTGLTAALQLTKQLEAFVEWDAFYSRGGFASAAPRHYAVGGLVYFVNSNFALDIRAGVGLNSRSNDFLAGTGFAVRF